MGRYHSQGDSRIQSLGAVVLIVLSLIGASSAVAQQPEPVPVSLPSSLPTGLADGVLSSPVVGGSQTLQVICVPEYLVLQAPRFAHPWLGTGPVALFGRLQPRELIVNANGSYTVIRLEEGPARSSGWLEWLQASGASAPLSVPSQGMEPSEAASALHEMLLGLREAVAGSEVERRVRFTLWLGGTLGLLCLSIPASGLIWRSALAMAERPWASLGAGIAAALGILAGAAGCLQWSETIFVPAIPALFCLPLLAILPIVVASALVKRLLAPMSLLGGLLGLAVALPLVTLLPFAGRPGAAALALLCVWALGGVLLSRIPGTGHETPQKEESHDQEKLDPDPCRPVADHGGLRPGDGQPDASPHARQPGVDPQAEPSCQHGPGNPDPRG